MKASYKVVGGSAWVVLFNTEDGTASNVDWEPEFTGEFQKERLAFSPAMFRAPRGNTTTRLNLGFTLQYGSLALAFASIPAMEALNALKFHLKVEITGAAAQYYTNACVDSYRAKQHGVSVDHALRIEADDVSLTAV